MVLAPGLKFRHMVTRDVYVVTRCEGFQMKQETGEWKPAVRYEPASWDESKGLKPEYSRTIEDFDSRFIEFKE